MSEQRLRDLLQQAIPEAPELDSAAIGGRAERVRRRRSRTVGAAVVAVVVAVVIGSATLAVTALTGDRGDEDRSAAQPRRTATPEVELSPYVPATCPVQRSEVQPMLSDLNSIVAVRLCPDFDPRSPGNQSAVTPEQRAEVEDADALVHGLADFAAGVRALPSALPQYCAADPGPWLSQSFAFYRADGSLTDVPVAGCELVTVEGRAVDGGALRNLYFEALDRQRSALDYTLPFDHELACDTAPRGGPIRPGREQLVAAVVCTLPPGAESIPPDLEPVPLDSGMLTGLDDAWATPGDPVVRGPSGTDPCIDVPEPPPYIVAATDRGDVVQLFESPCGFLVWLGWEGHTGARIPTTLTALTIE